jgi:hypothetical protein
MGKEVTYTKEQFEALSPVEQQTILLKKITVKGKGVVRREDGSIKYDDVALKGTYDEGVMA